MEIRSERGISRAIVLVLISLFMVTAVLVVLCGASAYGRATEAAAANNEKRVFMSYALNTMHMAPEGAVEITDEAGCRVVKIYDDEEYVTYLYAYDGSFRSLYTDTENEFYPEDGDEITAMAAFDACLEEDGLIRFTMTDAAGEVYTMHAVCN